MKERKEKNNGITLIALVVTIVVLLILAGITITTVLGKNGIITKAQEAALEMRAAQVEDASNLWKLDINLNQYSNGKVQTADEIIQSLYDKKLLLENEYNTLMDVMNNPNREIKIGSKNIDFHVTITEEDKGLDEIIKPTEEIQEQFNKKYGVIEIIWIDENNNVIEKPEAPVLAGLTPVKWTGVAGNYTETVTTPDDSNWYSYVPQSKNVDGKTSRWANAKITKAEKEAYFVWIPRYAYKIVYFSSEQDKQNYKNGNGEYTIIGYSCRYGMVDSKNGNKLVNGTEPINITGNVQTEGYKDYIPHPAFEFGTSKKGIWIGKYEPSGATNNLEIKPNVDSLVYGSIDDKFTSSQSVKTSFSLTGDTHMMKNTEWGVVTYLSESKYGRNGMAVSANLDSSPITGKGKDNATYDTESGGLASTTGNIYGIYDMAGGAYEEVAAYIENSNSLSNSNSNSQSLTTANIKYKDVYKATNDTPEDNYKENRNMYGDAICEISVGAREYTCWNNEEAYYPDKSHFVFNRGSSAYYARGGLFYYDRNFGLSGSIHSFRVVCTP